MLTHDEDQARRYDEDPLISKSIAVNVLPEMRDAAKRVVADAGAIRTPTLLLTGGADWVVSTRAQREFFDNPGSEHKEMRLCDRMYHDILHEKDRHLVLAGIRTFLGGTFPPPRPLLDADRSGYTCEEHARLVRPLSRLSPKAFAFRVPSLGMGTVGRMNRGIIEIRAPTAADSGRDARPGSRILVSRDRMSHVLALDQGTTSSRAILFDDQGCAVASARREFKQHFPRPGWVEHDPREIWATQLAVAREVADGVGDIAAIGIANQRETTIVWDRATGEPIYNAIVWQDRRTAETCDRFVADGAVGLVRDRTGLLLDAYFSATKIAWILDHGEGARGRAERGELAFGTIDTWLAWNLSGGALHITDASNASRTLLFDIHRQDWDDDLLALFGVPRAMLPEVRDSSDAYGPSTLSGIPIAALIGDQQAALAGQAGFEPGLGKSTYGTGCFLLVNTGSVAATSRNCLLTTVAWRRHGTPTYALEGSAFTGGAVVQWLRDGLGIIGSAADVEPLAASVEDSGGVVLVSAFTGLGAPHWDPYARGAMFGLTRGTTAAHIARAALEGVAFQVHDLVRAMEDDVGEPFRELRVDGGAAANDLLLQLQADVLRIPVVRPAVLETTALGAAYMAGLATGVWSSTDAIAQARTVDRTFEPRMDEARIEEKLAVWRDAVARSSGWSR